MSRLAKRQRGTDGRIFWDVNMERIATDRAIAVLNQPEFITLDKTSEIICKELIRTFPDLADKPALTPERVHSKLSRLAIRDDRLRRRDVPKEQIHKEVMSDLDQETVRDIAAFQRLFPTARFYEVAARLEEDVKFTTQNNMAFKATLDGFTKRVACLTVAVEDIKTAVAGIREDITVMWNDMYPNRSKSG